MVICGAEMLLGSPKDRLQENLMKLQWQWDMNPFLLETIRYSLQN